MSGLIANEDERLELIGAIDRRNLAAVASVLVQLAGIYAGNEGAGLLFPATGEVVVLNENRAVITIFSDMEEFLGQIVVDQTGF